MSIQAGLELDLTLGRLADSLDRNTKISRRHLEALKATTPADVRFQQAGTSAASGDLLLIYAGPATGFYWHVRRIVVGGSTWTTTVSGSAEVYVTASNSSSYSRDLADQVDQSITVPNKAFYSQHEMVIQPNENLIIVVRSPSASTLYKSSIQVQQFRTLPETIDYLA